MFEIDFYQKVGIDPKTGRPIKQKEKDVVEIVINKIIKSFEYCAEKMRESERDTSECEITIKNLRIYLDGHLLMKEVEKELKEEMNNGR